MAAATSAGAGTAVDEGERLAIALRMSQVRCCSSCPPAAPPPCAADQLLPRPHTRPPARPRLQFEEVSARQHFTTVLSSLVMQKSAPASGLAAAAARP
jgi:hypothetical protein